MHDCVSQPSFKTNDNRSDINDSVRSNVCVCVCVLSVRTRHRKRERWSMGRVLMRCQVKTSANNTMRKSHLTQIPFSLLNSLWFVPKLQSNFSVNTSSLCSLSLPSHSLSLLTSCSRFRSHPLSPPFSAPVSLARSMRQKT